jgi:hypothetical protein
VFQDVPSLPRGGNVTVQDKLEALKRKERIITNDDEMDAMIDLDGDTMNSVRSIPNPNRVGFRDQYIAWID